MCTVKKRGLCVNFRIYWLRSVNLSQTCFALTIDWRGLVWLDLESITPQPVSYTHLDVYKRQPSYCGNAFISWFWKLFTIGRPYNVSLSFSCIYSFSLCSCACCSVVHWWRIIYFVIITGQCSVLYCFLVISVIIIVKNYKGVFFLKEGRNNNN